MTTKTLSILFLFLFFVSCGNSSGGGSGSSGGASQEASIQSVTASSSVPAAALTWDANILFVGFTTVQEDKVHRAVDLMKKVIASQEFKDRIINYSYNGTPGFVDNGGFTNVQIYQKILEGAETLNGIANNRLDIELELYTEASTTIGYTNVGTPRIWMNTKYFDTYTPINVSDNLMHEWLHKLGFTHAQTWSASRDHSVPYAIGYLMEELAAKY
jgi:hypothetical protein